MSGSPQILLRVESLDTGTNTGEWASTLVIPFAASVLSFVLLLVQMIYSSLARWKSGPEPGEQHEHLSHGSEEADAPFMKRVKTHAERLGGKRTIVLSTARFLSCLFLFGSTTYVALNIAFSSNLDRLLQYGLCVTYAYASSLACCSLLLDPSSKQVRLVTRHLISVLFASWTVFVYRDAWPLATFTLQPADARQGSFFWVQFGVLTLAGALVPLVISRQYVPYDEYDSTAQASPEQTAPVLSRMFVAFLDPLVWAASRGPHVTLDELPALCDGDAMRNLAKRCLRRLDPIETKSKTHIYWILVRIFRWEHVELIFILFIMDLAYLGSPLAMNKIFTYLESGGEGAVVRPWLWISLLFFAPLTTSLTSVRYMSVVLRMTARVQGVMTQVIFDHALRVRLKADTEISNKAKANDGQNVLTSASTSASRENEEESLVGDASGNSTEGDESTIAPSEVPGDKDGDSSASKVEAANMIGMINNLVTTDLNAFEYTNDLLLVVFMTPFQILVNIAFLYAILGWSVFVGVGTMLIMLSVPGVIAKLYHDVQATKMKKSDARVQLITEIMGGAIRMVKLFGWEDRMSENIDSKRREELAAIWKLKMFNTLNRILNNVIPITTMVVTFATYTLVMKQSLTASRVFPAMAVFSIIQGNFSGASDQTRLVLQGVDMVQAIQIFTKLDTHALLPAKVSVDRINRFLHETELLDVFEPTSSSDSAAVPVDNTSIGIRSTLFTWGSSSDGGRTSIAEAERRRFSLRIDDEVVFKSGRINLIIGPTGSGKTSMLMALLGEMHQIPLGPEAFLNLPRLNGIAYHAQESWVLNDTIRNNILFGSIYDEERYQKVIRQCALERDLSLFHAGDHTEVGEKGITLSGGQKARITLARAVYSPAEILLLDDVLAALDVHTAQWIVHECLKGDLVRGRTVILVTHNIALASPIADFVVGLKDGKVVSQGSLSNALEKGVKLSSDTAEEIARIRKTGNNPVDTRSDDKDRATQGKLVLNEEISEGHVGWSALKLLFGNTGEGFNGLLFWLVFVGVVFTSKLTSTLETWVLSVWAQQYELRDPRDVPVPYYLTIYTAFVSATLLMVALSSVIFVLGTLRASRVIHKILIQSLLNATFRWLDATPSSRIITRCTQDIDAVDNSIVNYIHSLTEMTTGIIVRFGAVIVMSPIFGIPGTLLCIVGVWMGQLWMKAQLAVKRERSNARSPILGHITAAIVGLVSIRAYGVQAAFRQESFRRIDRYTRASITYNNLTRWISVRAEALAASFSTALAAYLVYGQAYDSSRIGFSLIMAVTFSHTILWVVRYFNEFEVEGNSLERIQQYLVVDQEPKPIPDGIPPAAWPTSGDLVVENLSARYTANGPEVLHNVSFIVKSGERLGIVGRTGSGKSSLTLALLRCIPTEGKVYYSGLATDTINLDALRGHITIIPQVPELLTGTLRENVDPFSQWDDATLNNALAAAGLFSLENTKDKQSRLTLDSVISSGGTNVSVGQRQIIALARAIVRQSKVLILDEATSAIDNETDLVIQHSLRKEVARNITLLTVAHRLQTIMDYDKIIVLDAGRLVEFGKPSELLKNDEGYFRSLVNASSERGEMYEIATRLPT